ncbi:radical SAM/SPASM domain-containing protein [Siphonobacter sp. SORGH_AS_0500]|nr:radical SAM/SPASM domain-containing protein [Siphonobacter sp. SORGH_AS_0500]
MMKNLIPARSPHLLLRPLDKGYFYAVNCSFPRSLRILSAVQTEVLSAIDGKTSVAAIAEKTGLSLKILEELLFLLAQTEIVRTDQVFSQPVKPPSPKSLNFWIHTTNRCNLGCSYCYIPTLHNPDGMDEATRNQLLEKVVETVKARKLRQVRFRLAGGEPLTQFKSWKAFIPDLRKRLAPYGCQFEVSFLTNLTILTEDIIGFAKAHRISFGVSLDGVKAYQDISRPFKQGTGTFDLVNRNLKRLLAEQIPVSINTVVNNQNLDGLPDLTQYLIDLDIPFRYSIVKGEAIDADKLEEKLLASYAVMKQAIGQRWSFSGRHQFCDLKPTELGFQTCASGFSGGAINVDGTLHYCHVQLGDASKTAHSIFDTELDLVEMIEQGSHEEEKRSADCRTCRYRSVCTSGCPVYRVKDKDPQCSLYHRIIPLIYDLQAQERFKNLQDFKML